MSSVGLRSQRDALTRSQHEGSDPLLELSTARILALRSMSDENLDLIERGTNEADMEDFEAVTCEHCRRRRAPGLLDRAVDGAVDAWHAARDWRRSMRCMLSSSLSTIACATRADDYRKAIDVATTDRGSAASASLDEAFQREIEHQPEQPRRTCRRGRRGLAPPRYVSSLRR